MLRVRVSLVLLSLVIPSGLFHAQEPASQSPKFHPVATQGPAPQEQMLPYWSADPGWHTEIMLRNNLASAPLTVSPVLRLFDGTEIPLTAITVPAATVGTIDLHEALMNAHPEVMGSSNPYGSMVLRYSSAFNSNLYASVMVHDDGHPILYHLDGTTIAPEFKRGYLEGIWWLPKVTTQGYFVLANLSSQQQAGHLVLYRPNGQPWREDITLAPRETQRFPLRNLIAQSGFPDTYGGIAFETDRSAGFVSSSLLLFDEPSGFAATMKMFDHNPVTARETHDYARTGVWTTRAPMLALTHPDAALLLPVDTVLKPKLMLRNTTNAPLKAKLSLHWKRAEEAGRVQLPELTLGPNETRIVDVGALQEQGLIPLSAAWAQVTLSADAAPDNLMAVATSYDENLRYGAQTPFSDQMALHLEGGAWQVDQYHDSLIAAGNGSNHDITARLTFFFDGGSKSYQIEHTIPAQDQLWVDVGKLIRDRTPDKSGTVLPVDLQTGAYQLMDISSHPTPSLYEGKVVTDKQWGHATYGCMICCGDDLISQSPFNINVGEDALIGVQAQDSCSAAPVDITEYFDFWSMNTAILTRNASTYMGHGVSLGSTAISARGTSIPKGRDADSRAVCPVQSGSMKNIGNVTACPTSVTLDNTDSIPISIDPKLHTGYGVMAEQHALPDITDWSTAVITESITSGTSTCPAILGLGIASQTQGSTGNFTVNAAAEPTDPNAGLLVFPAKKNVFYDEHHLINTANALSYAGSKTTSCQSTATQTYYCGGKALGTFSLILTYNLGTANGGPATLVNVIKK